MGVVDLVAPVKAFDRFQRRHKPVAVTVAVLRNFSDQEAGNASALIAYWAFFSIFPLLLLFVTVLGFVLQGDPSAQSSVVHSALSQFPVIGAHPATLSGNGLALAVGIVGALASGLGVTVAVPTRELWPGILLATVGWEILQSVGGLYVHHVVKGADQTYGTFATVIGLLAWLYLGARIVVYAAEINVVLTRRLWPRSIMDPPEPADRKARAALAKMEERDDKETVQVDFHPHAKNESAGLAGDPTYAVAPAPRPGENAQPAETAYRRARPAYRQRPGTTRRGR
jgi:uncharacterized BrkB/YihY/UPF0761 family membrane protein